MPSVQLDESVPAKRAGCLVAAGSDIEAPRQK
jgi:hypothetical protein